jgi:hypothetical protein
MKRVELTELLRVRQIEHPTRIVSTVITKGALRVVLASRPWWHDVNGPQHERTIQFLFEGVTRGELRNEDIGGGVGADAEEALETFEIGPLSEMDWAQPNSFSIFCSGPLSDPFSLYLRMHDYLRDVCSYRRVEEFLNVASGRLAKFVEITSSNSYLVATGPDCVRQIVCRELDEQAVRYNVIQTAMQPNRDLLVRLEDSYFLCARAYAEFEGASADHP